MTERISELFDYGDEIVVDGLDNPFDPDEIKEVTMQRLFAETKPKPKRVKVRRVSRTLLLAAVLSTLFVTSALAVGLSIHGRRQEQLNHTLTQGQSIAGYTEYELPEEEGSGVTLLSAIGDGEFELLYLNVSPVEAEEVPRFMQGEAVEGGTLYYDIGCRIPGEESIHGRTDYINMISFAPEDWIEYEDETGNHMKTVAPERMEQRYREQYYDAESKTLTICLRFAAEDLNIGEETALELFLTKLYVPEERPEASWQDEAEIVRPLGSTGFTPVGEESLLFMFPDPLVFQNEETGGRGEIRGIELVASGVNTFVWYEDLPIVYDGPDSGRVAEGQMGLMISWETAAEKAMSEAISLNFSDGSSGELTPVVAAHYEGGLVKEISSGRVLLWDIHSLVSVTVGDKVYPVPQG